MWLSIFMILVVKNDEPGAGHTGLCRLIPTPLRFRGPLLSPIFIGSNSFLRTAQMVQGDKQSRYFPSCVGLYLSIVLVAFFVVLQLLRELK